MTSSMLDFVAQVALLLILLLLIRVLLGRYLEQLASVAS